MKTQLKEVIAELDHIDRKAASLERNASGCIGNTVTDALSHTILFEATDVRQSVREVRECVADLCDALVERCDSYPSQRSHAGAPWKGMDLSATDL